MNTKHWLIGALTAAALAIGLAAPASAGAILCTPRNMPDGNAGTVGGTNSAVPSQTLYTINSEGCAAVSNQDVGYFRSQGYYPGPNLFSVALVGITAQTTAAQAPVLPAGSYIVGLVIQETAGQAVTGGLDIGIAGSSDASIASAVTCAASCLVTVADTAILLRTIGATTNTSGVPKAFPIYINAHTNWSDAAKVNLTVFYSLYSPT
jgi:hypothetical protein